MESFLDSLKNENFVKDYFLFELLKTEQFSKFSLQEFLNYIKKEFNTQKEETPTLIGNNEPKKISKMISNRAPTGFNF